MSAGALVPHGRAVHGVGPYVNNVHTDHREEAPSVAKRLTRMRYMLPRATREEVSSDGMMLPSDSFMIMPVTAWA